VTVSLTVSQRRKFLGLGEGTIERRIVNCQFVRQIRANPAMRDIPILAATAKALKGDEEKCLAVGCDGYIAKPFNHRQLEVAINGVLKRRRGNLDAQGR
jgi:CheY-like chemotaxis protein